MTQDVTPGDKGEKMTINRKAVKAISEYIYKQLYSSAAQRSRYLAALSNKNPIIKVSWNDSMLPANKPDKEEVR